jgi:hypothetical protein
MDQLQSIALNNYNDFLSLLMQKYNLPAPADTNEAITAVNYAADTFGGEFVNDIYNIQLNRNAIAAQELAYKAKLDASTKEQLKEELVRLKFNLDQANDIATREYILDKTAYVQKLIIQKQEEKSPITIAGIHKNNQTLLLILTAIALMFIGSKIFNK